MNRGKLWIQIPQRNSLLKTLPMTATILTWSKKEWSTLSSIQEQTQFSPQTPLPAPSTSVPSHQHSQPHPLARDRNSKI